MAEDSDMANWQWHNGFPGECLELASYENRLLLTLSLAEASMFIDRLALGILASVPNVAVYTNLGMSP
jgi:hypothetical protein